MKLVCSSNIFQCAGKGAVSRYRPKHF